MKKPPAAIAARRLLEMAELLDGSPLANTADKPLTRINAGAAMTCILIAAHHLQDANTETWQRLYGTAGPHAMALEPEHRPNPDQTGHLCLASSDSNGRVLYNCAFDDKSQICLNCPHLQNSVLIPEEILALPHHPALLPPLRPPDLLQAQQDALDILYIGAGLASAFANLPQPTQRATVAIAVAEALYYTVAALECSTIDRGPQMDSKAAKAYEEAAEILFQAMGAPPPSPHTTPHDACAVMHWHYPDRETQVTYACRNPDDDEEERTDRCAQCPLQEHPPRPMPWELLACSHVVK